MVYNQSMRLNNEELQGVYKGLTFSNDSDKASEVQLEITKEMLNIKSVSGSIINNAPIPMHEFDFMPLKESFNVFTEGMPLPTLIQAFKSKTAKLLVLANDDGRNTIWMISNNTEGKEEPSMFLPKEAEDEEFNNMCSSFEEEFGKESLSRLINKGEV